MKIINKITALLIRGYKKSFDPTGRDNRLQYVSIVLFQAMLFLCYDYFFVSDGNEIAFSVFIILLLPLFSSSIRRLHDAGYSAFVWLFVPFLILPICLFLKSEPAKNKYGEPEV
ncbi:DUF805 domain-containing protein [Yersinia similis]|uniref:Membrane protein n=2 Tax=Yersinia similis TaxID=367190 RepID=A0A0T9RJM3_9GAMM|nr:DUF805 domain-containing protein [Yersinia similis]AHK18548.1 membrane protein [Yersinia similis]CFQ71233.1 Predicted membrane protein [Yersinia similis]CNC47023.1 Predicted membrane protein [Yersinia similis]CNF66383.1 Predicted membrane protein [Yersinia similis]CNG63400.1 Predicted membrane protein [Yersinia similis]